MKVTAVVPSYEPDEKLIQVVDGLLAAGFDDIVVVNDGSHEGHLQPFAEAASRPGVTVPSLVGKVNCTCNAFRYNVAYPDAKYNVLGGVVKSHNRIPNKIRNSKQIPTVCKHVYSFLHFLYNKNILVG